MAKYKREVYESAGRLVLKEAGGIKNLTEYCVGLIRYNGNLEQGCKEYVKQDVLIYTADREAWLKRRGINTKNPDKIFDEICGKAANYLVLNYMKKHKLGIIRVGKTILNAKLVKM